MTGPPLPRTHDVMLARNISCEHFGFYDSRPALPIQCVSGIGRVESVRDGICFLRARLPAATPQQRRDVLIRIVQRTASVDGLYNDQALKQFTQIAEETLQEAALEKGLRIP